MDPMLEKLYNLGKEELQSFNEHLMIGGGTPGPTLVKGKGVRVEDIDGTSYIDCTSQSWALYLGYGHPDILRVIEEHSRNLTHVHQGFNTVPRFYLAKRLAELAPEGLNRVSFTVGGGSAIEAAMKIALKNRPNSKQFVSLYDAYHGSTLGVIGSSWISTKAAGRYTGATNFLPAFNDFVRAPNPYCYKCYWDLKPDDCALMCAKMLDLTLEKGVNGPPAGVIIEPIQASAGQIPCPQAYLERVREICDKFETLLIFDEIQTFARVGRWFAADYYSVTPDIIVLGKALGGGLPIAAIIIKDGLEGFGPDSEELHTFANSSLAQVTALKQLEVIERDRLLENATVMGEYICSKIESFQKEFPQIGDIRGVGLHIGVEFVADPVSKSPLEEKTVEIRSEAMKGGVFFGLGGVRRNVLKIKPPLIINRDEADEVLEVFYKSAKAVLGK